MKNLIKGLVIVLGLVVCLHIVINIISIDDNFEEPVMETAEYTSVESYDEDPMMDIIDDEIDEMMTLLTELYDSGEYSDEDIANLEIALMIYSTYITE